MIETSSRARLHAKDALGGDVMRLFGFACALLLAGAALADTNPLRGPVGTGVEEIGVGIEQKSTAGMRVWIAEFKGRALAQGIGEARFDAAMSGLGYLPDVVYKDAHQTEFTKTIWDYLDKAVSETRIADGQKALKKHKKLLQRIEDVYGVEAQVVVAIWGLESAYGAVRGDVRTLEALATLAYDGRRGAFFESELLAALRILQSGDVAPEQMRGSWAGAMGHTQFMPTSYQAYAVDFTGDGKRDIWGDDPTDALASTAAYLARFGWQKGQNWALEVSLPPGFDYGASGLRTQKPMSHWRSGGLTLADGGALPQAGWASVLLPAGARGAAFLVFDNFSAIESYNSADAYVIAVGHLADRIIGGPVIRGDWPRDDRALSLPERRELQQRLLSAGFDPSGVDGKIGPLTIAAVKAYQRANGLIPDGYASLDILTKLR